MSYRLRLQAKTIVEHLIIAFAISKLFLFTIDYGVKFQIQQF